MISYQNQKKWDLGVICGRFSHAHLGHVSLFDTCQSLCKKTLILVGSAQESKTLRNPFCAETRIKIIKQIYPHADESTLMIRGIPDLSCELDLNDHWGSYLKSKIISYTGQFANVMVYGNDPERVKWFSPEDLQFTCEYVLPRTDFPISATEIRGYLLINQQSAWEKVTHPSIHSLYNTLRNELMEVPIYQKIYKEMSFYDLSIESYYKVYQKYEMIDRQEKLKKIAGKK